jgi:hypothetical protein
MDVNFLAAAREFAVLTETGLAVDGDGFESYAVVS